MFSNITIVNIDGRAGEHISAQMSLVHSKSLLPGAKALLLSPQEPICRIGDFDFIKIEPLDYFNYSLFVLYKLHRFIETDFALIVQDDGWVINPSVWDSSFLKYDYIGAPTHSAMLINNKSKIYFNNYTWTNKFDIESDEFKIVMNGGFSLRSKKLLETPSIKSLNLIINPPTDDIQLKWQTDTHKEDVQICLHMREELEKSNIKFPPMDVARKFSIEHADPLFHNNLNLMSLFGHHSKFRKLVSLNPLTIQYQLQKNQIELLYGEAQIVQTFINLGYKLKFLDD